MIKLNSTNAFIQDFVEALYVYEKNNSVIGVFAFYIGFEETYGEELYIYQNAIYGFKEIDAKKNTHTIYDLGEGIGKKAIKKIYGLDRSYFVMCCD